MLQKIDLDIFKEKQLSVFVKRDDLIHPFISGNKYRKLFYGLKDFKNRNVQTLVTFGGAFSNHIHAFAFACHQNNIQSIGIIRGEELQNQPLNDTLSFAVQHGMKLVFVSRKEYKRRNDQDYLEELKLKYNAEIVPEGGSLDSATLGLIDMVNEINQQQHFDFICTPCGTGGTIAGIVAGLSPEQQCLGFLALKGIDNDIKQKISSQTKNENYTLISDFDFGGYAKYNQELIDFLKQLKKDTNIQFDQVYNGKMMFGLFKLIESDYFKPNTKICIIHTGGLQGLLPELRI